MLKYIDKMSYIIIKISSPYRAWKIGSKWIQGHLSLWAHLWKHNINECSEMLARMWAGNKLFHHTSAKSCIS